MNEQCIQVNNNKTADNMPAVLYLSLMYSPHNRNIVCHIYIIRVNVNIISFIRLTALDATFLQHQFVHWS